MSVSDSDLIDSVGLNPATGKVVLAIFDELTWEDPHYHGRKLSQKIEFYVDAIRSGRLAELHKEYGDRAMSVRIFLRSRPDTSVARECFDNALNPLIKSGIEYTVTD